MLPRIAPAELVTLQAAFDHPEWLFELKHDGFRAVAYIARDTGVELVSRKGHVYKSFASLGDELRRIGHDAVLDGEIACLDGEGRSVFNTLLYRRGTPVFYAFDCLWLDGRDLRARPLIERKRILNSIVPSNSRVLYARHVEATGRRLFEEVCRRDLEGVVAKWKHGQYGQGWVKIRNPKYSQMEGRRDLFGKFRSRAHSAAAD